MLKADNLGSLAHYLIYVGIFYALWRHRKRELILIVFPLVLFFIVGSWRSRASRYLLPLAPFFALIAAYFFDILLSKLKSIAERKGYKSVLKIWKRGIASCAIAVLIFVPSVVKIFKFDYLLTQKDTRTLAKEWIDGHVPKGSHLALESYGPPISTEKYLVTRRHTLGNTNLDWLSQRRVEYIVISDIMYARFVRFPEEFKAQARFYRSLDEQTVLIKTIKPKWNEYLIDLHNPTIKIYMLSKHRNYNFPGNFSQYSQSVDLIKEESGEWRMRSAIESSRFLEGDERVKHPYVKIVREDGEEVLNLRIHDGEISPLETSLHVDSSEYFALSAGDKIYIGYEYDLISDTSEFELQHPLKKEYLLVEEIEESALMKRKNLKYTFLYTSFPNTRGDDYFQIITLSKDSAVWTFFSTIFGGELRVGDDYVLNPFVKISDLSGALIKKIPIFFGSVGSFKAKRKAFAKKTSQFSTLPKDFRIFAGYDYYYDDEFKEKAGGPELVEINVARINWD